jgi:hydroxymethylpyrimidine/phosphomethylpyrimidine kinase
MLISVAPHTAKETKKSILDAIQTNALKMRILETAYSLACINQVLEDNRINEILDCLSVEHLKDIYFSGELIGFINKGFNGYDYRPHCPKFVYTELKKCCRFISAYLIENN